MQLTMHLCFQVNFQMNSNCAKTMKLFSRYGMNLCFSGEVTFESKLCDYYKTTITCENNVSNIGCPDSMSIFIIDGFYGRTDAET